jgi:MFS family permease
VILDGNDKFKPAGLAWRSSEMFIVSTVAVGIFSDTFLHSIIVPILPFVLHDHVHVPPAKVQGTVDGLLAAYAVARVVISPFAGALADRTKSRQLPYLFGLISLILSTVMLYTGRTVLVVIILSFARGASCAIVLCVGLAMCIDTVGPNRLGVTTGRVSLQAFSTLCVPKQCTYSRPEIFSFVSVGDLCAPVVGGILYEKAGYEVVAAVTLSTISVDLLMRLLVI